MEEIGKLYRDDRDVYVVIEADNEVYYFSSGMFPKATGWARRTHDIPVRCTATDGRACAKANPGATTMYGPLVCTLSIIDPV